MSTEYWALVVSVIAVAGIDHYRRVQGHPVFGGAAAIREAVPAFPFSIKTTRSGADAAVLRH